MNILICDDISAETEKLKRLIHASGFEVNVKAFNKGGDALRFVRSDKYIDACLLDIIMPDMSGIDLAKELRAGGFTGGIVFLSASKDYGPESYEVNASDYLQKPVSQKNVNALLSKLAKNKKIMDTKSILLKSAGASMSVLFYDICYAEVVGHKVIFRLADGSEAGVYITFKEVAARLLEDARFVRCHRSFIVNIDAAAKITTDKIIMRSGASIPISRSFPETKNMFYKRHFV
jgi:DNA-binding LytR/AlgR family response regulator